MGSSGTRSESGGDGVLPVLQTLMGSSGTLIGLSTTVLIYHLQTLMGSSGTLLDEVADHLLNSPSNPHGFVWNRVLKHVLVGVVRPSNPHGFVWNHPAHLRSGQSPVPSNPHGFVWNSGDFTGARDLILPSNPHGFVWNASFRDSSGTRSFLQTLMGSSGTLTPISKRLWLLPSNPHGFVWNPRHSLTSTATGRSFKPSWVRLERGSARSESGIEAPSNPHGFVWNQVPQRLRNLTMNLQTLMGSSGTRRCIAGAAARGPFKPSWVRLELFSQILVRFLFSPSNPHGFVWNFVLKVHGTLPKRPSNPHGFVWNLSVLTGHRDGELPSNPHGFVWNDTDAVSVAHTLGLQTLMGSSGT